mmetsp:Transcript_23048/g.39120  ORF Transcript_23048/g.39120 Transcript_23048/m.39120 type:complete len:391 (+) Transcript_23048:3304-4476(+)
MRSRGAALAVGLDSVLNLKPRGLGQLGPRRDAHARDNKIHVARAAVGQFRCGNASVADQPRQPNAFAKINAVLPMQCAEIVTGLWCSHPLQDAVGHLDQGHLQAQLGRDRCRLQPDIAATDDQNPCTLNKARGHGVNIRQVTHGEHTIQITADLGRKTVRNRSGSKDQIVIGQDLIAKGHGLRGGIHARHNRPKAQINIILGIKCLGTQKQTLQRHFAHQVRLGQRRALIGRHRFGPDQGHTPFKSAITQLGHAGRSRLTRPNYNHMAHLVALFTRPMPPCSLYRTQDPTQFQERRPYGDFPRRYTSRRNSGPNGRGWPCPRPVVGQNQRTQGRDLCRARGVHTDLPFGPRAQLHSDQGPVRRQRRGRDHLRVGQRPLCDEGLGRGHGRI